MLGIHVNRAYRVTLINLNIFKMTDKERIGVDKSCIVEGLTFTVFDGFPSS